MKYGQITGGIYGGWIELGTLKYFSLDGDRMWQPERNTKNGDGWVEPCSGAKICASKIETSDGSQEIKDMGTFQRCVFDDLALEIYSLRWILGK